MAVSIVLMESSDRQLAGLVRSAGLVVTSIVPMGDFTTLDRPQSPPPDVLLLDLRGQSGLPQELTLFKRRHPRTGVVIVASQLDPSLMLEAMRAGVTEWVTEPLAAPDLKAALSRVRGQHGSETPPGQVFAFLGAKGGVGTTTLAVNVAAALATEPGSQVLLADLHVAADGDAALLLGVEPKFSVVDALENAHRLDEAFLDTLVIRAKPGLDVLASPERPALQSPEGLRIRQLIECLSTNYRTVILDVPRSDISLLDALEPASVITLVVNQELPTVRRAAKTAALLRQRHGKDKIAAVVCRYDARAEIGQEDIERAVGLPVWGVIPSDYRLTVAAANDGRPFVLDTKGRLPIAIREFSKRLTGSRHEEPGTSSASKRMATRIAGLF